MSREISHRYLKDRNGDTYFPVTHIDAIEGLEVEGENNPFINIAEKVEQLNKMIEKQKTSLELLDTAMKDMVGDSGWVDISIPPNMKNNAVGTGFKSSIREVSVGNRSMPHYFIIRSIRLNISEITGSSMQIAQLPTGFITSNQSFLARQHGNRSPVTVECLKDGKVMAYIHPDDQSKNNWIYQEYTWLE
ncbi:hypothetical protein [Staphylococcus pettenkoferi]|uniref:hypothetical protein n=1 Tax=Staphylococcus pettenkoferi TaxID=170573 RepID=UPI002276FCA2|nr:hypothetical protein [Staphylococcus pettenkoferi]MCY1602918.1 hypothetical protein [Staphylococcus pettenkoferi]